MNKREIGYEAEQLVASHYQKNGYTILENNFTIQGGELDIVAYKDQTTIFIEVKKVSPDTDLHNYISKQKLNTIKKSIEFFCMRYDTKTDVRCDIVFVAENKIHELYENIAFS